MKSVFLTIVGFSVIFGGPGFLSFVSFAGIEMGALNQSPHFIPIKVTADSGQHIFGNR